MKDFLLTALVGLVGAVGVVFAFYTIYFIFYGIGIAAFKIGLDTPDKGTPINKAATATGAILIFFLTIVVGTLYGLGYLVKQGINYFF